jgi:hypothetical protein
MTKDVGTRLFPCGAANSAHFGAVAVGEKGVSQLKCPAAQESCCRAMESSGRQQQARHNTSYILSVCRPGREVSISNEESYQTRNSGF